MSARSRRRTTVSTVAVGDRAFVILDVAIPWGATDVAAYCGVVTAVDAVAIRLAIDLSVIGVNVRSEHGQRVIPWRKVARLGVRSSPGDKPAEITT